MQDSPHHIQLNLFNYGASYRLLDVVYLLLSMYMSYVLLGNPLFGAAVYIAAIFWMVFSQMASRHSISYLKRSTKASMGILFVLALALNVCLLILYPFIMHSSHSLVMVFFVFLLALRSVVTDVARCQITGSWTQRLKKMTAIHLGFFSIFLFPSLLFFSGTDLAIILLTVAGTGVALVYQQSQKPHIYSRAKDMEVLHGISSFRVYSGMALYCYIAFYLGLLFYIFYMFGFAANLGFNVFFIILAWILFVCIATYFAHRLLVRSSQGARIGVFIGGAAMWIFSSVMLFQTEDALLSAAWSLFWGVGLACMHAVLTSLGREFKLISVLIDEEIPDAVLTRSTITVQNLALLISSIILLAFLTAWNFFLPQFGPETSRYIRSTVTDLPLVFMMVSIVFALRQTMDRRNQQRLQELASAKKKNPALKNTLKSILVSKYRKRFGVRILMVVLRPFLYHKVLGREHVAEEEFPAIFVCNHGEIYGPIVAVLYLPYYFRPWVDERMLAKDKIVPHMYEGTFSRMTFLPKCLRMGLTKLVAGVVRWALLAFDPIPVARDNIKGLGRTFQLSVDAMESQDNILLFPENPSATEDHRYAEGDVGSFFTGFAHIGRMYYRKTGKCPTFYPIFADKRRRTFTIGEGIRYQPDSPPREEKLRIARELEAAMQQMARGEE